MSVSDTRPKPGQNQQKGEDITRFWRHIFCGQKGLLYIWTAIYDENGDAIRKTIRENNFYYPDAASTAAKWALDKSEEEGRNVYFCAHLLTGPQRIKENAAEAISLWGELDGADLPNGDLKPTAVVESSPGRYHVYWRLADAIPPGLAESLNKRLAHKIDADPSGFDLSQLLRVPGTTNYKYPDRPTVKLLGLDGAHTYVASELDEVLPESEEPEESVAYEADEGEPPVVLDEEALKVWRGEKPVLKDDGSGEIDRSRSLVKIGRVLYDARATRSTVIAGIKERDAALDWRCYTDRRDAEKQYAAIFKELQKEGRNTRAELRVNGKRVDGSSLNRATDVSDVSDIFSTRTDSFPVDALPEETAEFTREAAASLDCPPELVGLPVLCALSGAMGHTRELRVKQGWSTSGCLYAAIVDEPGSRKSPAQGMAYKPLQKLQVNLRKDYKKRKEAHDQEMREHAVEKKKAAKEDRPEPAPPKLQKMHRCIVDDITIEALAMRLEENPRGFLSAHDELTGFIRGMDQYKTGGKGNTRQSYLKIWSNLPIYVDRKGSDEPVIIPSPFVTIQGAIQPDVLHEISGGRNDGFLDRFLFAYPNPHVGGYSEKTVSLKAETAYQNLINGLWNKVPFKDEDGDPYPHSVEMDYKAKQLFIAEAKSLAADSSSPGFPTALKGPWAKFDTHLARLALIIAVARRADKEDERVTEDDMRSALALVEYFKSTTKKVCGEVFESNPDDVLAADISTFLSKRGNVFFGTISKLMKELPSVVPSVELPDTPQGMGRALARIVERTPSLELTRPARADDRSFRLVLKKTSETSETSGEEKTDTWEGEV